MRVRTLMLAVLVSMATAAWAQAPAEQAILQAEKDRFAAMIKGDRAGLERVLAEDLFYTHSNALLETKAEFIKSVTSGAIDYVSIVPSDSDRKVHIKGDVAVLNGVAAVNVIDKGNDLKFKLRYTTVYRNEGGRWLLTAWQSTRFPQ